jgi:hypothetical protein
VCSGKSAAGSQFESRRRSGDEINLYFYSVSRRLEHSATPATWKKNNITTTLSTAQSQPES